jgi:hypothetical protein
MVVSRQYDRATSPAAAGMPQRLFSRWDGSDCLFQAVQSFIDLADDSDRVPKLSKGRRYAQFEISNVEWRQLGLIHEVLQVGVCSIVMLLADKPFYANQPTMEQEIADVQHAFSSEGESTVAKAVLVLEWLQTRWEQMAEHERYRSLAPAIRAGLDNLGKWYKELDVSDAYVVCHSTLTLV